MQTTHVHDTHHDGQRTTTTSDPTTPETPAEARRWPSPEWASTPTSSARTRPAWTSFAVARVARTSRSSTYARAHAGAPSKLSCSARGGCSARHAGQLENWFSSRARNPLITRHRARRLPLPALAQARARSSPPLNLPSAVLSRTGSTSEGTEDHDARFPRTERVDRAAAPDVPSRLDGRASGARRRRIHASRAAGVRHGSPRRAPVRFQTSRGGPPILALSSCGRAPSTVCRPNAARGTRSMSGPR